MNCEIKADSGALRVLIVDDYEAHVDTLVDAFNSMGCHTTGIYRADQALAVCNSLHPHLIIYDGLMEGMRAWRFGFELFSHCVHGDLPYSRPYMVALTGFGNTLQRRLCEECGYDEYVTKPIDLEVLRSWCEKAKARRAIEAERKK